MTTMKRDTYISAMLTITATLLTVDLWARFSDGPLPGESVAMAQSGSAAPKGVGSTAARAFEQRKEMVKLLKQLNAEVAGLRSDLRAGAVVVKGMEPATP